MAGDWMEIVLIELNRIVPNDYNPNVISADIMAKLRAEIGQKGLCEPIIVRRWSNDGYLIVDGYHRWLICRDLGYTEVPCIIQDYDDKEAKIKTIQLNYMRGMPVPIKLASLIHDLSKEIKLEDLTKRLPYEEVQLKDNLELLKLPEDFGKTIENQAEKEAKELPSVISFVLYQNQLQTVEDAVRIAAEEIAEGTKNQRAVALTKICADYLENKRVTLKTEDSGEVK